MFSENRKYFFSLVGLLFFLISPNLFATAIDYQNKNISITLGAEPPSLNTLHASDQVSFFILEHVMEGLLALDAQGKLIPGIAKHWNMNETEAVFYLRDDAYWSDGKKVRAQDFVFAWRSMVNPKTAARYAFIMSPIKNAERINGGELPVESLGVVAIDDYTLRVTFERPCAYFLSLTAFVSYYPVREDFYKQRPDKYFSDIQHMVFNGPFKLSEWTHGSNLRLDKNQSFWNKEAIQINGINIPYITKDTNVAFNLFRNNEIVYADLGGNTIKQALQEHMHIKEFKVGALEYINFNHRNPRLTANHNLRLAIKYIFEPEGLVYKVVGIPGNQPSYSIFPTWLQGYEKPFYLEYPPERESVSLQKAQHHLQLAKKELKLNALPPLILLTSDIPGSVKKAEYLQGLLQSTLNIQVKIDKQIFKQRLSKMKQGDFDLTLASWGPDYNDPSTFSDLFYSKNSNNYGRYKNKKYDYWVNITRNSSDTKIRMEAFSKLQTIIQEDLVIIPYLERGIVYVENPGISNVARRIFGGDPSFRYASIIQPIENSDN